MPVTGQGGSQSVLYLAAPLLSGEEPGDVGLRLCNDNKPR